MSKDEPKGQTPREVKENVREYVNIIGNKILGRIKGRSRRILRANRRQFGDFEKRIRTEWGTAFDMLELLIQLSFETGAEFNKKHRPGAAKEKDFIFEVLTRLHGRGCRTAAEILVLMRSGYASGALSRWRTLHELAVVATFIRSNGQHTASKYLLHEAIESCGIVNQYQRYCGKLRYEPYTEDEVREANRRKEELCKQYGKGFGYQYGWASLALAKPGPTFAQIEETADLSHLRPFYKLASHDVHAGPKGIMFNIGVSSNVKGSFILAGPSNMGMADPGQCTAISLYQMTAALVTSRSELESLARLDAMNKLREETCLEFARIHDDLERSIESSSGPELGEPRRLLL